MRFSNNEPRVRDTVSWRNLSIRWFKCGCQTCVGQSICSWDR